MEKLACLITKNTPYLVARILYYARENDYLRFMPTLEEAWLMTIKGLSRALQDSIKLHPGIPGLKAEQDYTCDPMASFGVVEAARHRQRGVTPEMFLGLMKYYRQAYIDLVAENILERSDHEYYMLYIMRFFDRNEIAFCSEWSRLSQDKFLEELQNTNRNLSLEKTHYLTIFESIPTPVMILDAHDTCQNMNFAALQFMKDVTRVPGAGYYSNLKGTHYADLVPQWLVDEVQQFHRGSNLESTVEKDIMTQDKGRRQIVIRFHRMLDISGRFEGTVIILDDLTEQKQIENQLRYMSFHDALTGLYNRAYFEEELQRLGTGRYDPIGCIAVDVDGLKLVNDTLGHQAGDYLLAAVALMLHACFRTNDVLARIGGDEFAVLMPKSDSQTVARACQRIEDSIVEHNSEHPDMPISISLGWQVGEGRSNDVQEIFKEADNNMYQQKSVKRGLYHQLFQERWQTYGNRLFKPSLIPDL